MIKNNLQGLEGKVLRYRAYYGKTTNQLPLLHSGENESGKKIDVPRRLLSAEELLYERVHGTNEHDTEWLRKNPITVGVAVIGGPQLKGEVLVSLYSDPIVKSVVDKINPDSEIRRGKVRVDDRVYEAIRENAFVIQRKDANAMRVNSTNKPEIRNAFWEYISGNNLNLVNEYTRLVQQRSAIDPSKCMRLHLDRSPGLSLLCVGPVTGDSYALGYQDLDLENNYLVGKA